MTRSLCGLSCAALIALHALASSSCAKNPNDPSQSRTVTDFLAGATTVGGTQVAGTTRSGTPPPAAGGPTATTTSSTQASGGSPNLITISGSAPFQTIFLSIGSATTSARATTGSLLRALVVRSVRLFEVDLGAAAIETTGFLQIDLPAPVTEASVVVNYSTSLSASTFELQVQIASAGGAPGPVASVHKTASSGPGLIEMVGVVFGQLVINPANPTGPGLLINLVSGATVSTSLDSRTTRTDTNGAFDLLTDTLNGSGRCYTLTIQAAGYPTYSTDGWIGSNKETGGVVFTMSPGGPVGPINGVGCGR